MGMGQSRAAKAKSIRRHRLLRIQTLEERDLLAGDVLSSIEATVNELAPPTDQVAPDVSISSSSANLFQTADAGSTRGTAADLGSLDGDLRLSGRLGWFDRLDVLRFDLARQADFDVGLSDLTRNADLFLLDENGRLIGSSTNRSTRSEGISQVLDAGEYYVAAAARTFRQLSYTFTISAQLVAPAPDPSDLPSPLPAPATPVNTQPDNSANAPETTPGNTTTAPATETTPGNVRPLNDVAYFGGNREWNLNAVGAPEAWAAGYTGQGVTVAVIDTGVDLDHPDLVNSLYVNPGEIAGNGIDDDQNGFVDDVHGYDFAARDANPNDSNGHGTHVAGTIAAANNGFGATGVAPDAKILPVRVLDDNGSGTDRSVAAGIRYAADLGAQIINLSLGGGFSHTINTAINYAQSLGSLIVAAAGNESAPTPGYPARFSANYDNVISVGAHDSSGNLARFSNDVGNSGAIQVDAPGVGVFSTYAGGSYRTISGTSMASPHIAGLAALTLSANPDLTSPELRQLLTSGIVGSASGSDALGRATATTSVAYAAAGLTLAPQSTTSADSPARSMTPVNVRATDAYDLVAIPIEVSFNSLELSDERIEQETSTIAAADKIGQRSQSFASNQAQRQTHRQTSPIDQFFAEKSHHDAAELDELNEWNHWLTT